MLGIPAIPVTLASWLIFGQGEYLREVAMFTYLFFVACALFDNDYSNLRRIGMDEYRNKI
jgi:hypothetical protein